MPDKTGASAKLTATIKHLPRCRASDIPMKLRDKIKQDVNNLPIIKRAKWHFNGIFPEGAINRNLRRGTHHPYERVWFFFDVSDALPLGRKAILPLSWWPTDKKDGTRDQGLILQVMSAIQNLKSVQEANLSIVKPGTEQTLGGSYTLYGTDTLGVTFFYETPEQAAKEEEAKRITQGLNTIAFQKALADWFIDPDGLVAKMRAGQDETIKRLKKEIKRLRTLIKGGKQ